MSTILCVDDFTCTLTDAAQVLWSNGYTVFVADDSIHALELAAETSFEAVLLNCQNGIDNSRLVAALRILQPRVAVVMFSGYCAAPCRQLHLADACFQKGETSAALLALLRSVICQSRYGLCRSVA